MIPREILTSGGSEVEVSERKDLVTDALNATKAAAEEGIVPGGGTALIRCAKLLDTMETSSQDAALGVDIVRNALFEPASSIIANTGISPAVVVSKVAESSEVS